MTTSLESRAQTDADLHTRLAQRALINGDLAKVRQEVERAEALDKLAARVVEPRTYQANSPHSWFIDQLHANDATNMRRADEAKDRLARHAQEMGVEARLNSPIGQQVRAQLTQSLRTDDAGTTQRAVEQAIDQMASTTRAMTSGAASGGSFVTPIYDLSDTAPYHTYAPAVANAATRANDPGYGLTLNVPVFTSGDPNGEAQLNENSGPPSFDAIDSSVYATTPLETLFEETEISQQLIDRVGPGPGFDQYIFAQLGRSLDVDWDVNVITAVLANAGTVTDTKTTSATTAVIADLWSDLANAASQIQTAPGVRAPSTHIFFPSTLANYYLSLTDGSGRPIVTPTAPTPGQSSGVAPFANFIAVPSYMDGNLPLVSGNSQIVVLNAGAVYTLRSTTNYRIVPEPGAASLSCLAQGYAYAGSLVTHAAAVVAITGARYPATATFAQV